MQFDDEERREAPRAEGVDPGVTDEIERACEEVGLDEEEKSTVLDCIRLYVHEGVKGSTVEVLREAIRRCWGADEGDCDLCKRILERR